MEKAAPGWNAANTLVQTLADCGVDTVFGNPGTTEMPLVAALDDCGRPIKAVLALHENVCSARTVGFWRTAGRPAATLLHLGPGLTNAAANLHNARRARSGIVSIIGEHGLHLLEDVLDGIEMAPQGLVRIVHGQNKGKQLIRLISNQETRA